MLPTHRRRESVLLQNGSWYLFWVVAGRRKLSYQLKLFGPNSLLLQLLQLCVSVLDACI